ncbi:MAG: helix-turn-helix transcriptional regulator [Salinimicrobium sp.]
MQEEFRKISDYWEKRYSHQIEKYQPFEISSDFKKFASLFALGNSFLYIVNLHNFGLEYISSSVEHFVKKDAGDIVIQDLLKTIMPDEIESISLRSKVISDFYMAYVGKESVSLYKNMFTYRMKDADGQLRMMLYQAFPLSVLENGTPEHVFCIQTDVSHLKMTTDSTVSFIHMDGGKCYFNVNVSKGKFDPAACECSDKDFSQLITDREKQIVNRLSRGLNAEQIAMELNLSPHTIKTHRKNVLKKTGCLNTTELVAKCLINGVISPALS